MTDETTSQIHRALGSIAVRPAGYTYLGRGDNSGVIIADMNARTCWTYTPNQPPVPIPLVNDINIIAINRPELEGCRVLLGFPPQKPNVLHITDLDYTSGNASVGGITPEEQMVAAQQYMSVGNLINFRLSPNDPLDSEVYINPGWYLDLNGNGAWWGGDSTTPLLTAAIAALSSGTHQMAATFIDAATNTPAIVTNTAEPGGAGDKQVFDTTTIEELSTPSGYVPTGAVHLYFGQTLITEDDIYRASDPRIVFNRTGSSNSLDSGLPLVIGSTETYTVTANRQLLFFAGLTILGTFIDNPDSVVEIF
jgi:hypothetical protein